MSHGAALTAAALTIGIPPGDENHGQLTKINSRQPKYGLMPMYMTENYR